MSSSQTYRIALIQGDFFNRGEQNANNFFNALFDSFSLLSWASDSSEIVVLDEKQKMINSQSFKIYTFNIHGSSTTKLLIQFQKNKESSTINYSLLEKDSSKHQEQYLLKIRKDISVSFSLHKETSKLKRQQKESAIQARSTIFIDIIDNHNVLEQLGLDEAEKRIHLQTKTLKNNQIEYFYKEPHSRRYKEIPFCHFNLAFQGGGAKGVSYVGVFKALKELHRNIPITSIIGSSAGAILALAISTEMKPQALTQLCLKMDSIPKNKYYSNESQIKPQDQKRFDSLIHKIKCLLHNQGILESSIFDQLLSSLDDLQTSDKILNVLQYINPSIAELFSLQLKKPVPKRTGLFSSSKEFYTRRFNYYGLLQAGLIKGDSVEMLAAQSVIDYFSKHFNPNYIRAHPHLKERKLKIEVMLNRWGIKQELSDIDLEELLLTEKYLTQVKKLTMKQYYDISGVELTCTSTDLDDQILRFFNHKTTPNLPVCKSVQMSGSFPVAFAAQQWQKEWGKYYIHYSNTRRQIDLTGHTFTDGGLLANFPIKYLDNQQMRPMYFSHKKNANYTILYGFGLDQISNQPKDPELEQEKQAAIAELTKHIKSNISTISLVKNLILSNSEIVLDPVKLTEIPVLNFLLKLFNTLSLSDYNLNIECFTQNIILSEIQAKAFQTHKDVKKELSKFKLFRESIQAMRAVIQAKKQSSFTEVVTQACVKIRDALNEYENPTNKLLEQMKGKLLASLYNYQGTRIKYQIQQCQQIKQFIKEIEEIYPKSPFKMQETMSAKTALFKTLNGIEKYCEKLEGKQKKQADAIFRKIIDHQLFVTDNIHKRISQIISVLENHEEETMGNSFYNKMTVLDYHLIYNFTGIDSKFFIMDQPFATQIFSQIKGLDLPGLCIENQISQNLSQIESQLKQIIRRSQHNKIHLVLESKENSHLHFCGLFDILQGILHQHENIHKSIDMITTSDIHSIFAFLLAGGKKISNIRKEMWKVKDLISFESNIQREFSTFSWSKTESIEMKQLMELAWNDHYRIMEEMQNYLLNQGNQDLAEQIKSVRIEYLYNKNKVINSMEHILDYASRACYEALKIKDNPELQKKRLAQYLSLKNGKEGKDYTAKNQKISHNTQRFIKMMMHHFEQLLINLILENYIIKDTFELVDDPRASQLIWKGVLVKKLLSSKKLELYIKNQLEEMKLNQNTTLSQFYQFCPRKITLNFALINKKRERMELINRFTSPNMPVWAAIIASTSMPLILPECVFSQQWQFSPFSDSRMRKLIHYFFSSPQDDLKEGYISGNFVSTLPLQLLTNHKIALENYLDPKHKEKQFTEANKLLQAGNSTVSTLCKAHLTEENAFTFITFGFKKRQLQSKDALKVEKRKKQFLSFSNVLNLGVDYLMGRFKNIQVGFKDIIRRLELFKYLSIRIECHDNTIMSLYYDQTIKLPIALGTLDFYKIDSGRAEVLLSCIYQSQFVVRGIFQNLWVSENCESFGYQAKKQTYLQYEIIEDEIHLKFISKTKWNRKLATMYKIFWKLNRNERYRPYDEEEISFPTKQDQIFLKFDFPDTVNLKNKSHQLLLNFKKLKDIDEAVFFKFNYEELDKRYLLPVKLFSQRLKTRVIPPSKAFITSEKIQESVARMYVEPIAIKIKQHAESGHSIIVRTIHKSELDDEEPISKEVHYLLVKTVVSFKNDGLYCKECVRQLTRTESIAATHVKQDQNDSNECCKCHHKASIIGFQCNNKKCTKQSQNRFCFPCLFVYLLYFQDGVCRCSIANHQMQFVSMRKSKEVVLCHFCSNGTITYYRDHECDINLCYKCSLILEAKKMTN